MKIEVNVRKKYFFIILGAILFFGGSLVVFAFSYTQQIPNPGHGADTVWVSVPGQGEMTLQDAITNGKISTGQFTSLTFAQAVRKDGPTGDTGSGDTNRPIVMVSGLREAVVAINNVVSPTFTTTDLDGLKCNDALGWKLAGCWAFNQGSDTDIFPYPNGCVTNDFDQDRPNEQLSIACIK